MLRTMEGEQGMDLADTGVGEMLSDVTTVLNLPTVHIRERIFLIIDC
jgi:hypothetical protein